MASNVECRSVVYSVRMGLTSSLLCGWVLIMCCHILSSGFHVCVSFVCVMIFVCVVANV